jgi:hypothetical protein
MINFYGFLFCMVLINALMFISMKNLKVSKFYLK